MTLYSHTQANLRTAPKLICDPTSTLLAILPSICALIRSKISRVTGFGALADPLMFPRVVEDAAEGFLDSLSARAVITG